MPNGKPYDNCPVCHGPAELAFIIADREIRICTSNSDKKNRVLIRAPDGDVGL